MRSSLFPTRGEHNAKQAPHETPRNKTHETTQNKNNNRTTAVVQLVVFFNSGWHVYRISHEYSSLFYHSDEFDICVFTMIHRLLGSHYASRLCICSFVLRSTPEPRVMKCFKPNTGRSKALVLV